MERNFITSGTVPWCGVVAIYQFLPEETLGCILSVLRPPDLNLDPRPSKYNVGMLFTKVMIDWDS
jgi:hypothetical protein